MKRNFALLFLCFLQIEFAEAQTNAIDSLKHLLQNEKQDTSRVLLLNQLSKLYVQNTPDTALILGQQGFTLAKKIGFTKGVAASLNRMANAFSITGNYPKALELHLESLKMAEDAKDENIMRTALVNIGGDYISQGNYRQSISYTLQALSLAQRVDYKPTILNSLVNLGDDYEKLGILDSARLYTNRGYDLAVQLDNTDLIGIALNNLGNIYSKMEQPGVAMANYNLCLPYFIQAEDEEGLCEAYLGIAALFRSSGNTDSSLYYAKLSLAHAQKAGFILWVMNASNFLTDYYTSIHNVDSAFAYQSATIAAKDSLFNQQKQREMQSLSFDETMRQQKMEEDKAAAMEEHHHNIQYAIIAIGLLTFLIIFLVYSRTIVATEKAIKFLGILALLLVFELLNLFIHPYIGALTHHSPILQLLIAVVIAALLIPLHHRLQHLITHQMVVKNKRLRLAAAERTVAKLKEDKDLSE